MQDNDELMKSELNKCYEDDFEDFSDTFFVRSLDSSGMLLNLGGIIDMFFVRFKTLVKMASLVSLSVKLETIRKVRVQVGMSLSKAKHIIEGEKTGLYTQDEYNPPKRQDSLENIENMANYLAYRFEFGKSPLLVAKANIDIYNEIIRTLDREEEMILIELKNGKSLDKPKTLEQLQGDSNAINEIEIFKKELLTLNIEEREVDWIEYAPEIIEEELPLPMFSSEEIQNKRKDEKILIAGIGFPYGNLQLYGTFLSNLSDEIYDVKLNNESDSRVFLQSLYEKKEKLELAKKYADELHDGFKHDFAYFEDCSIKVLNGQSFKKLEEHRFSKFTFWRHFAPIFKLGDTLQKDNYFIHNIHLKGQLNSIELDKQLPVIYVTEFFLNGILDLIKIRYLILNRLIEKLEKRLGATFTNLSDTIPTLDQAEENDPKKTINLTHREIATLYYLNGLKDLTYPQAEDLALFHGQKSRTSGKKLKEQYWNVFVKEEGMNHKYNAEIYTHSNSYQSILKIIPLLEKEENIKLANEYLKKSEPYKYVKSKE
jgi:hypothetical protein